MKRLMIATALTTVAATSALATTTVGDLDLTGDSFASMEEVKYAFPDFDATFFDDIDTNDDMRLSAEEVQTEDAQAIFARYDMIPLEERGEPIVLDDDGDGFISIEDMRRGYPQFTALDFEEIDTNDDNRVSYQEIYALDAQTIIGRYNTTMLEGIAQIDTSGDGFADADEMMAAYPGLQTVDFEEIDLNDDNRISSNELYAEEAQTIIGRFQ